MPETPRFGTDGWRGIIAEDFTAAAVRQFTQALALELRERLPAEDDPNVLSLVVGFDTRFGSGQFAATVTEVLAAHDLHVYLCRSAVPSPVVSHAVIQRGAIGGVVITASHNPAQFNGIKLKGRSGAPASSSFIRALEERIATVIATNEAPPRRAIETLEDDGYLDRINPLDDYLTDLEALVDIEAIRQAGLTIVVDAMYGAGAGVLPALFRGTATKIIEINGAPNPAFPNLRGPEPIAANLTRLIRIVQEGNSGLGIAFDGDADRLGLIGPNGDYISAQRVFALLTLYLLKGRGWNGPLIKSLNGTAMIDRLGEDFGVPVYETPVGFTALAPLFREHDGLIAGEEAGGFAIRSHIPDRDAIFSALLLLEMLVHHGNDLGSALADLEEHVGQWYYERADLTARPEQSAAAMERVRAASPRRIAGVPISQISAQDGVKFLLDDGGWLLIRPSGTEPILRLYAESPSPELVTELLQRGRELSGLQ